MLAVSVTSLLALSISSTDLAPYLILVCSGINFHARLQILNDNGNIGCLAGGTGGATSFEPGKSDKDEIVVFRNITGNFCDIKGGQLCALIASKGKGRSDCSANT